MPAKPFNSRKNPFPALKENPAILFEHASLQHDMILRDF